MKKISKILFLAVIAAFFTVPQNIFAQSADNQQIEDPNEYDDGDDYNNDGDYYEDDEIRLTPNGAGDQFINIQVMPVFPLNFGNQLYPGGALCVGYHKFLTDMIAVGGDVMFAYNPTIGSNIFTFIPFTMGITFQPYVWRFEFPITLNVGAAIENYLQYNYFPGLFVKGQAGAYYRMNETWSFGAECNLIWMPQWYKDGTSKNYVGITATLGARYHF